jgi:hypothetical protein
MDNGPEKIEDEYVLQVLRRQARKVYLESLLTAAVLTALCLLLPVG